MEKTGSALPLCDLNPVTLSLDPHSELLSAPLPEPHLAKLGARCQVEEIFMPDFQLLFILEPSLHLSEPRVGVMLSALLRALGG